MALFDTLKTIITGKDAKLEDIADINTFVMCRWLSGDPRTIMVANMLNRFPNIPTDKQYEFAKYLVKHKVKYLRYYKNKHNLDEYENISKYYNISLDKAYEYAKLMSQEEFDYINAIYKKR